MILSGAAVRPEHVRGDGVIYYSTRTATVGLVVKNGVIVETPPYARGWALGREAVSIWRQGLYDRAILAWITEDGKTE